MKFKTLLLAGCLSVFSAAYAGDHAHLYPQTNKDAAAKSVLKNGTSNPDDDYCTIQIFNASLDRIWVYGTFDDGTPLETFSIPRNDPWAHLIHLEYYDSRYGYTFCHPGMYIYIEDSRGRNIYSKWTLEGTPLTAYSVYGNLLKVEANKK